MNILIPLRTLKPPTIEPIFLKFVPTLLPSIAPITKKVLIIVTGGESVQRNTLLGLEFGSSINTERMLEPK